MIVLWNKGKKEVRYDWLQKGWCVSDEEMAMTKARMTVMLDDLLSGQGKLRYTSRMPFILNEHAPVSKVFFFFFLNKCNGSWGWLAPLFSEGVDWVA